MEFIKFPKTYETVSSHNIDHSKIDSKEWMVTEKIHGANVSIYVNKSEIKLAKRTGFLEESEVFFGFSYLKNKLENPAFNIFKKLSNDYETLDYVIIYGELCGGWYPESPGEWLGAKASGRITPDGKIVVPQKIRGIQEGVYYSNSIGMIVFDIIVVLDDKTQIPINYDYIIQLCQDERLDVNIPLARGSYNDMIHYDINFDSLIPKVFGKEMAINNTCEGIVIRPVDYSDIGFCSVKIKNKYFAEICDKSPFTKNDEEQALIFILSSMVNYNRLYNVVSEIGIDVNEENREEIVKELIDDIITEYHCKYDIPWTNYEEKIKYLNDMCNNLLLENMSQVQMT